MNKWKTTTIILSIIVILQFSLFIYFNNIGTEIMENENECAVNICSDYNGYYYDMYEKICYCFEDSELVYEEYLGAS